MTRTPRRRRVELTPQARADIERLAGDDDQLAILAVHRIRDLEAGRVDGQPLHEMAKVGDLGHCRKLYFGVGNPTSHRIVYRSTDDTIEICEVVAIEARDEMYAYLLASLRLGRLPVATTPQFNRIHQQVIARRGKRR